jgi:hypothetical protein
MFQKDWGNTIVTYQKVRSRRVRLPPDGRAFPSQSVLWGLLPHSTNINDELISLRPSRFPIRFPLIPAVLFPRQQPPKLPAVSLLRRQTLKLPVISLLRRQLPRNANYEWEVGRFVKKIAKGAHASARKEETRPWGQANYAVSEVQGALSWKVHWHPCVVSSLAVWPGDWLYARVPESTESPSLSHVNRLPQNSCGHSHKEMVLFLG